MSPKEISSGVLTIRVPRSLDRRLAAEARRQSRRASQQDADAETLTFIEQVADDRGWR